MLALIDYGLGNIEAFFQIFKRLGINAKITNTIDDLKLAKKIILPGVGAFDWAMTQLNKSGLRECLDELVLVDKVPVLGICVGMHMMAKSSEEGELPGLAWIDGVVKKFDKSYFNHETHLPHMGWNDIVLKKYNNIFKNPNEVPRYYFLHSYYILLKNKDEILAETNYGVSFTSAICSNNIFGVQFHPEKSHQWGIQLLKNFSEMEI